MKLHKLLFFLILLISTFSCKQIEDKKELPEKNQSSSDLQIDHFNIWVENPQQAKEKLINLGFTAIPDSLSKIHHGQGTTGRYFYFLNTYLELIYVNDQQELEENNEKNKELDFTARANFKNNGASPFSTALKIKDYEVEKIPFKTVRYHQDWMEENVNIYSAVNSKINLKEPSVFVIYPEIEWEPFDTLDDLNRIPEEYAIWREFHKHKNGAKKVTKIVITSPTEDWNTDTMQALSNIKDFTIKKGVKHEMEVFFDDAIQGKTFDLRPELPLIIHL